MRCKSFFVPLVIAALMPLAALSLPSSALAQDPPPIGKDLPPEVELELGRIGHDVIEMGTIQAGPEAAVIQAVATPESDADRWWFSAILPPADASPETKANAALLLKHINEGKFKSWVIPGDKRSWALFQQKQAGSQIQQDWLKPVEAFCEKYGYPAIVIQPPRNEDFGKNAKVVCSIGGYKGDYEAWNTIISDRVKAYTRKHYADGSIQAGSLESQTQGQGHAQQIYSEAGGRSDRRPEQKPPFEVPEPVAFPPDEAIEHLLPEKVKPLTLRQIQDLCPDAPVSFIREQHKLKLTDPEEVSFAYLEWKEEQEKAKEAEKKKPSEPPAVAPLTADQIHAIIPDASVEFVGVIHQAGLKTPEAVTKVWAAFLREYQRYSAKQQALKPRNQQPPSLVESDSSVDVTYDDSEVDQTPANPTQRTQGASPNDPASSGINLSLLDLLGLIGIAVMAMVAMWHWQKKQAAQAAYVPVTAIRVGPPDSPPLSPPSPASPTS